MRIRGDIVRFAAVKLARRSRRDLGGKLPDMTGNEITAAGCLHRSGQRRKNRLARKKVHRRIKGQRGAVVARVGARLLTALRAVHDKRSSIARRNGDAKGRREIRRRRRAGKSSCRRGTHYRLPRDRTRPQDHYPKPQYSAAKPVG